MADEVAQAPAVQSVEAAQAEVLRQQLQVFPCYVLRWLSSTFVIIHFPRVRMFRLSS